MRGTPEFQFDTLILFSLVVLSRSLNLKINQRLVVPYVKR